MQKTQPKPYWLARPFSLVELLVMITTLAVFVALLLPAIQRVREVAHRIKYTAKLKQIMLACRTAQDAHDKLPPDIDGYASASPGCARDGNGFGVVQRHLLPFVDDGGLRDGTLNSPNHHLDPARRARALSTAGRPSKGDSATARFPTPSSG